MTFDVGPPLDEPPYPSPPAPPNPSSPPVPKWVQRLGEGPLYDALPDPRPQMGVAEYGRQRTRAVTRT